MLTKILNRFRTKSGLVARPADYVTNPVLEIGVGPTERAG